MARRTKNSGFDFFTSLHILDDQLSTYEDIFIENRITEENLSKINSLSNRRLPYLEKTNLFTAIQQTFV